MRVVRNLKKQAMQPYLGRQARAYVFRLNIIL